MIILISFLLLISHSTEHGTRLLEWLSVGNCLTCCNASESLMTAGRDCGNLCLLTVCYGKSSDTSENGPTFQPSTMQSHDQKAMQATIYGSSNHLPKICLHKSDRHDHALATMNALVAGRVIRPRVLYHNHGRGRCSDEACATLSVRGVDMWNHEPKSLMFRRQGGASDWMCPVRIESGDRTPDWRMNIESAALNSPPT